MTDHAANLARVQALRADNTWIMLDSERDRYDAVADHVEDVLTRHAPDHDVNLRHDFCNADYCRWPCPDYISALTLLDALDGGGS